MVSKEISIMNAKFCLIFWGENYFCFNTIKYEFLLRNSIPYESNYQDFNSRYKFWEIKLNCFTKKCQQNVSLTKKSHTTKNSDSNGSNGFCKVIMGVVHWLYIFLHLSLICIKNDQNALKFFKNYFLEFFQKLMIFSFRNIPETQGMSKRSKKGRKKRCYGLISYYNNYFFILYILPHKQILQKETEKNTKIANLQSRKSYNNISSNNINCNITWLNFCNR